MIRIAAALGFLLHCNLLQTDLVFGGGAAIKISWNANQEPDLSGYKVYCGTSSGNYGSPVNVGKVTTHVITGLQSGLTYYIALTAYDTSANESTKSAEISGVAQLSSTTTSSPAYTSTVSPTTTTTSATTPQPTSSTTSMVPVTSTTTIGEEETSSCNDPVKLQPIAVTSSNWPRQLFPAENLIDGDPQTEWSTIFTFFRKDASIILDMGSDKLITSLYMDASRLFGIDYLPSHVEIQISSDNANWQTISNVAASALPESRHADSWHIKGDKGRYIKISMSGRKSFFIYQPARIAELSIYGCDDVSDHLFFSLQSGISSETEHLPARQKSSFTAPTVGEPLAPGVPGKPFVSFN